MWSRLNLFQTLLTASLVAVLPWYLTREADCELPSIRNLSIKSLQELLSNGTLSSEDLVETYLARITKINPSARAVLEINPVALDEARKLDDERQKTGVKRSALHGIPILVKGSISVDGMNNSAGSYCLLGSRRKKEASVITRLKKAGAVILGTTNMSEWGNSRSSSQTASNGWSAVGGQTYGVYHHEQDPCGSSSGSGVAMALGLAAGAVGVETVGSITCPAMRSNLVSIKTTSGLVPRDNIIVTKLRGSVGRMTHTVEDAAIMLNSMAGPRPDDPLSLKIPFTTIPDYTKSLNLNGLLNSRLAVPRNNVENPWAANMNLAPVMEQFEHVLDIMRGLGATIIDNANYTSCIEINAADAPQNSVGPSEYRFDMENYFKSLAVNPHNIQTMEDLINCTKSLSEEEYPSRDIAYWERVVKSADLQSPKIKEIKRMRYLGGKRGIDGVLRAAKADAIVFPSVCSSDVPDLVGYPVVCVPLGFLPEGMPKKRNSRGDLVEEGPGIPFGISFIGTAFSEERLIELAYAFEQHTMIGRERSPVVLPRIDLCEVVGRRGVLAEN